MTETRSAMRLGLRIEALAVFCAATALFWRLDGSWTFYLIFFFTPDVALAGYLVGNRAGAWAYNAAHSTVGPLALGIAAMVFDSSIAVALALIWLAHIGFDRALGYGLKHESGFKDTHLGRIGGNSPA